MSLFILPLLLAGAAAETPSHNVGTIEGLVVNASQGDAPVAGAEVILRVRIQGQFTPVEETVSDANGRFRFASLPVGADLIYLPGANQDGVHYPGRRTVLTSRRPEGYLRIPIREAVEEPNPLIIRELEIVLRGEPGALHVVEAMLVDNPGTTTYIGKNESGPLAPVTLALGITSEFQRLTFEEEFFGRQFEMHDGSVVTSLPWMPGPRWLRYTYSIPNDQASRLWRHRIELPCERVRVRVLHDTPDEIECNLTRAAKNSAGETGAVYYQENLATGDEIVVTLGRLPIPWMVYARWSALCVLVMAVVAAALFKRLGIESTLRPHRRPKKAA